MHTTALDLDRKSKAVLLLARGVSTEACGEQLGVDGSTVRRWRQDSAFAAQVRRVGAELFEDAVAALRAACKDAVRTLHASLDDESANIRVRAASTLLATAPAFSAHFDLEARITQLEATQVGPFEGAL